MFIFGTRQELTHPSWKRHGCHLFLEKTISLPEAENGWMNLSQMGLEN